MYILNLFVIAVILVSFYFQIEFSYLISLFLSLTAATFIYAGESLANIVFAITIFNLTPLATEHLKHILQKPQTSLQAQKDCLKAAYQQTLKEGALFRQSNDRLNIEITRIAELYRITKDMSAVLGFAEIFNILGKNFKESFQFKKCRMILVDEDKSSLNIKQAWELEYGQAQAHQAAGDPQNEQILKRGIQAQRIIYIKEELLALAPLMAGAGFLGVLAVEGIAGEAFDNFSILFNQFSLEFKRVKLYQKVQELAITDGLTGQFARRYFLQRLTEELKRSSQHHLRLAFLMIDIDYFKQCNDNFGHLTGDVVLREVAEGIKACVREIDLVGRFGGEEFSVLLPDTDKESARLVAERIRENIENHKFLAYGETIKVKVSVGVAGFPEDTTGLKQLIDKSDQALYRAKQEGRNRVCLAKKTLQS